MKSGSRRSPTTLSTDKYFTLARRDKNVAVYSQQEVLIRFVNNGIGNQKQTVWSTIALTAPDQLRQRVRGPCTNLCGR